MAWLSGITGKAENFLNSLDQKAASVLHENEIENENKGMTAGASHLDTGSRHAPGHTPGHAPYLKLKKGNQPPAQSVPAKVEQRGNDPSTEQMLSTKPKMEQTVKKKADTDEALFAFLNSAQLSDRRKSTPVSNGRHSRQSSSSSVISNKGGRNNDGPASSSTSGSSMVHVEMPETADDSPAPGSKDTKPLEMASDISAGQESMDSKHVESSDSRGSPIAMDIAALEDAILDQSPSNSVHSNSGHDDQESHENVMSSSSMDLENRLLKSEIASLNQEMSSLVQRAKQSQTELARLKEELGTHSRSASKSDQMVRELQNREQDLVEALGAKDSQLAVLRVRLEESDREMEGLKRTIDGLQAERQRILRDHTDSSGIHGQALDSLRQKLMEVESSLQREQEANKMSQKEASERQTRSQDEQRSFTEALTVTEKKYADEKGKVTEVTNQLKATKHNLEAAKQELSEYKEKATRILQSKERLIANLREGSGASGDSVGVSHLEYDTVKQERDMLKEEIQQSRMTLDNFRVELADVEAQMQQESDTAADTVRSLEDNINEEKQRREDAEQEILKQKREIQYSIEELHRQKSSFQSRLSDREADIEKLRNQLATKSMSSTTESELESRVRDLTESLIQKQTMVEALSTEKNSLGLQLERLEQQYKDIQASAVRTNTTVIPVHEDEDVRHRLPIFMREGPADTEVTRKMKRAANTIDRFSIRLGVFLRRYPIARVFVIVYMAVLHLWVMIVLLTYQPEIHGPHDMKMPAPPLP